MTTTTRNIIEELKRAATEQGAGEAVRTIAGPALETWMRALDGKDADPERLDDLATLMTARLSIRDAALNAAVERGVERFGQQRLVVGRVGPGGHVDDGRRVELGFDGGDECGVPD